MTPDSESNVRLEIGHVLFIDLVGYSKLLIEDQKARLRQLTDIVLATAQVREATNEQLIRLPTGDGRALVFRNLFAIRSIAFAQEPSSRPAATTPVDANGTAMAEAERVIVTGSNIPTAEEVHRKFHCRTTTYPPN